MLTCQRYIELNPVRARITDNPLTYRWSICAAHLGQRAGSLLTPHPAWVALVPTPRGVPPSGAACWTMRS